MASNKTRSRSTKSSTPVDMSSADPHATLNAIDADPIDLLAQSDSKIIQRELKNYCNELIKAKDREISRLNEKLNEMAASVIANLEANYRVLENIHEDVLQS